MLRLTVLIAFLSISASTTFAQQSGSLGFQKRFGDEIMVCGQLYRIGSPVKLWLDPGGYDAYRTDRRFASFDQRKWKSTVDSMKEGKIEWVTKPQELNPDRYGLRYDRDAETQYTPEQLEAIRGGGWDLPLLREKVDQFVLHFDVCGTSGQCFYILHDVRGLSVHFMLDVDGTIYQTLDLKERAWHSTKSNDRSIGIEIANIGAYQVDDPKKPFAPWYQKDENGTLALIFPEKVRGQKALTGKKLTPRRAEPVRGKIRGREYEQMDYTQQQYDALVKLTAALTDIFPKMKPDAPRTPEGKIMEQTLTDEQWASFSGILGHYHVQTNKSDPGPAMDWEYLLSEVRSQKDRLQSASKQ
jgi:N-acetylmuramoyl-L-alanine amidase